MRHPRCRGAFVASGPLPPAPARPMRLAPWRGELPNDGTDAPARVQAPWSLALADDGPATALGWVGLTPETPTNHGEARGQVLHLTVLDERSPPRTLDLVASAGNPQLGGIAMRDRHALVLWTGVDGSAVLGMIVSLDP